MKPVKQQFKHDPTNGVFGDCHRAAMATVLALPIEAVPHFGDGDPSVDEFFRRERDFLAQYNLRSVQLPFGAGLDDVLRGMAGWNGDVVYLLGGQSRTGVNHTVVCRGAEIVHDPSSSDAGIVGPCSDGHYWVTCFAALDLPRQVSLGEAVVQLGKAGFWGDADPRDLVFEPVVKISRHPVGADGLRAALAKSSKPLTG